MNTTIKRRLSRSQKRNRSFWIVVGILLVVAIIFLYGGNGLIDSFAMKRQVYLLKKQNDSLLFVNEAKRLKLQNLANGDAFTLEVEARKNNMIFPEEKVFIIRPEPKKQKRIKSK